MWSDVQGWDVPAFHIRVCEFLESFSETALLMMPRGHAKSTILAVYNAWRYYCDSSYRILHQGDQDDTAYKMSRDTLSVLERHPLTKKTVCKSQGEVQMWWVNGSTDPRNPNMQARGITSNVTSSRADEIQNDDVEVPRNIQSSDAREKLRYRLSEQTHILVPGGRRLYVGTPHTHHSLYDEVKRNGAECLILRMFENNHRELKSDHSVVDFKPVYVFTGIGAGAKLLIEGHDYTVTKNNDKYHVMMSERYELVDIYGEALWPERFTPAEMARRRKECRTVNEWDSQYMLMARPIGTVRLDPERVTVYDCEPEITRVNGGLRMTLNGVHIVSAALTVDPASGKLTSDVSALALILQDGTGRRYWHRALPLTGEVAEFAEDGKTITGGQVFQICDVVEKYMIQRVHIETNGIGKFMPAVMKAALKQRKLVCGVYDDHSKDNKNKRILEAFEPLLLSNMLFMSRQVADSAAFTEMLEFNPAATSNADDYIDAGAKAISANPERIQKFGKVNDKMQQNWSPVSGTFEVQVDY